MREPNSNVLVVGLGNPGTAYDMTRHNAGHDVVCAFAKDQGWEFKNSTKLEGKIAKGNFHSVTTYLLLPMTYMNSSGIAVRKTLEYYGIDVGSLLVIADDIFIPFGSLRLREKGAAGGHNGLKSVEASLLTSEYQRLRIGVGNIRTCSLEEHVLSRFTEIEFKQLPEVINHALAVIDFWVEGDTGKAIQYASTAKTKIQGETA